MIASYLMAIPGPEAWNAYAIELPKGASVPRIAIKPLSVSPSTLSHAHQAATSIGGGGAHLNASAGPLRVALNAAADESSVDFPSGSPMPAAGIAAAVDASGVFESGVQGSRQVVANHDGSPADSRVSGAASYDASDAGAAVTAAAAYEGGEIFDGELVRVFVKFPGSSPTSSNLDEFVRAVHDDPATKARLTPKTVVRIASDDLPMAAFPEIKARLIEAGVLADRSAEGPWANGLRTFLGKMGFPEVEIVRNKAASSRPRWVENAVLAVKSVFGAFQQIRSAASSSIKPRAQSARRAAQSAAASGNRTSSAWRGFGVRAIMWIPRNVLFMGRNLIDSFTLPNAAEIASGVASSGIKFAFIMVPIYAGMYLPKGQYAAFAAVVVFDLWLNLFHNVLFTTWWSNFTNRIAQQKGLTYLYFFNVGYGLLLSTIFREISSHLAGVESPFSWSFFLQSLVITFPGGFAGVLGTQAGNEFYNKGYFNRTTRTFYLNARKWLNDASGAALNTGAIGNYLYLLAAVKIGFDASAYILSSVLKGRMMVLVAAETAAATNEFRKMHLERSPQFIKSILKVPFVPLLMALGRWLFRWIRHLRGSGKDSAQLLSLRERREAISGSYRLSKHDDISLGGGRVRKSAIAVAAVLSLTPAGRQDPQPIGGPSIEAPILVRYPNGDDGVFKRIVSVKRLDPMYKYKRMSRLGDAVGGSIMSQAAERMGGVPVVEYELATTMVNGQKMLGVVSRKLPIETLSPEDFANPQIGNIDEFLRGSVIDAWMGNPDRIFSTHNLWVLPNREGGKERNVIFGDFNQSLRLGIRAFGIPKVPAGLFTHYANQRPEVVRAAIQSIADMSDDDVREIVDNALSRLPGGYGASARDYLVQVLTYNRDEMRDPAVFADLTAPTPHSFLVSPDAAAVLSAAVTQGDCRWRHWWPFGRDAWIVAQVKKSLEKEGYIASVSEPMHRLLETAMKHHYSGSRETIEVPMDDTNLFMMFLVYNYLKIDPEASIAAGFGYNR